MARYRVVLLSEVAASGRMDAAFHCYTRDEKIASVRAGVARDIRALRVRITAQRAIAERAAVAEPNELMQLFYTVREEARATLPGDKLGKRR